ncbi:MAG TPA: RsmB/NOP family class I SAM-dependent RNA methyltransferase [Candidatus Acidoferrum sp.]|nr:RsmB/NOP family class I SAM-dependent RNA methyltransferase [Candidatus Acidoferrum sp.]
MTPGARLQAAIELLAAIHEGSAPADRAAAAYFRGRRYIGGQDRRDIIDRVYAVLRHRARLEWWLARAAGEGPTTDRWRMIAALALLEGWPADRIAGAFDGGQYRPAPLDRREREVAQKLAGKRIDHPEQPDWVRLEYPHWLDHQLRNLLGPRFEAEMAALGVEAPLDLRVNTLKATRADAVAALAESRVAAEPTLLSPIGLRVRGRPPLATLPCFRDGLIEVQDEGSQIVALLADARPGMRVVDFCAGAGGKTLAMAAAMGNKGHIVACDVLRGRVDRAATRLARAGVHNVERRGLSTERDPWVKRHARSFDRVLVDAPCSGVGTWRRNPDAKWRFGREDLTAVIELQRRILDSAARLVKPGGRLIYATCSLLPLENAAQVTSFVKDHPEFTQRPVAEVWADTIGRMPESVPAPAADRSLQLTPAAHETDGFFVAVLERSADVARDAAA